MTHNGLLIIDSDRHFAEKKAALFQGIYRVTVLDHRTTVAEILLANPDIVIINRDLPDNLGIALFTEMKTQPQFASTPVIFLADADDPETEEAAINLGAADYLSRSVDGNVLRARVNRCLLTKHKIDRLSFLPPIDPVPRLANRQLFNQYLAREWGRAVRLCKPIAVVALELTGLDILAEQFGQSLPERCLTHVARLVEQCLHRPGDFPARYVDNKILILLPDTDLTGAGVVLEHISAAVKAGMRERLPKRGLELLGFSAGFEAIEPGRSDSSSTCIRAVMEQLEREIHERLS